MSVCLSVHREGIPHVTNVTITYDALDITV